MYSNKPFVKPVLNLGVIPVITTVLITIIGFIWIQNYQYNRLLQRYAHLIENTINANIDAKSSEEMMKHLHPLLNVSPITNLSLIDVNRKISTQLGLPLNLKIVKKIDFNPSQNSELSSRHETFYSFPITLNEKPAWILVTLNNAVLKESLYFGYLFIVILSVLSIIATLIFKQRLLQTISTPLEQIIKQLRLYLSTREHKDISVQGNTPYSDLAETINEMVVLQQSAQEEMQHSIEQSTKELRETLETVEIQNIELDIARKNALQASRAKSEFLANTSHELRTPLNGILGFTSLLLKTGLSNQQNDYLATIEQSAQGLLTVINDILDFSKLETGQLTLEYKAIYVRELIEDVFSLYAPQAHEKNIRLISIVNHNVPRNLLGDPQRLKQVLTNLISNAIKFSARGNIVVKCNILGEMDNQIEIKFNITDNGIGIPEEQQDNLFTAFTKVDSSDSRFQGGTGLGLAIAKGLVDRMHGDIGVESEPRSGSNFWFTVRLGVDRQRISQSPLVNSLYGVKVLIFDANTTGLTETSHLLASWGINFVEEHDFSKIEQTLQLQHDAKPDLLVFDSYFDGNNFDKAVLLNGIRKITGKFNIPIILLAPPAIQRILQDDIIGLNTLIVPRPIAHNLLHQSICNLLSIAEPLPQSETTPKSNGSPPSNGAIRVLVVDDNPANRKLVCEFLKSLDTHTTTAQDGFEALQHFNDSQFDLVLMDVQMPGMDGLEATQKIRAQESGKRTPIVALTAHAVAEQKTKLLLAGMDDFLSKPVSEEDLINLIERWVRQKESSISQPSPSEQNQTPKPFEKTTFSWSESMSLAKNKEDLAADMLRMLIESLPSTEEQIQRSLEEDNLQQLFDVNHKFHGGCCYCGVPAARQASKELEEKLHKKDLEDIRLYANNVIHEIQTLRSWSEEHDIDALFIDAEN